MDKISFASLFLILILSLILISACSKSKSSNQAVQTVENNNERYDLLKVYSFIDNKPTETDLNTLKLNINDQDCELRKLSTAILYKYDKSYKDKLYKEFEVNDYKERSNGIYNYEGKNSSLDLIKNIENKQPYSGRSELIFLNLFCYYQDKNIWIVTEEEPGKISMARFFRGAFLVRIVDLDEQKALELEHYIDKITAEKEGFVY